MYSDKVETIKFLKNKTKRTIFDLPSENADDIDLVGTITEDEEYKTSSTERKSDISNSLKNKQSSAEVEKNNGFVLPAKIPGDNAESFFSSLSEDADKENVYAQFVTGYLHVSNQFHSEDKLKKGTEWYKKAALKGFVPAQYAYASIVLDTMKNKNIFTEDDVCLARKLLDEAVEKDHIWAINFLAVIKRKEIESKQLFEKSAFPYESENHKENLQMYQNLAKYCKNNSLLCDVMQRYADNYEKTIKFGSSKSLFSLAILYQSGYSVPKDPYKAFDLFEKAAKLENIKAYFELGYCYEKGIGTQMDIEKSNRFYELGEKLAKKAKWHSFDRDCFRDIKSHRNY